MNNTKDRRIDLTTGDDAIVTIGKVFFAGRVMADTETTLTVRYKVADGFNQAVFNRGSGYERASDEFAWETPRLYAPHQWVIGSGDAALTKFLNQGETK